jgi:hypothetical protein
MPNQNVVILDKNFLQKEDRSTPRLRALALAGCEFVLTDTLIYEICSDERLPNLWPSVQWKLNPFADRLHLWFHTAELVRQEVAQNGPISGPEDADATRHLREWFRSDSVFVPRNLKDIVESASQQREVDSMEKVSPMARAVGRLISNAITNDESRNATKNDFAGWFAEHFNDRSLTQWMLRACNGNADSPENHIPDAENRITPDWFAFHNARVTLALIGIFLVKYGLAEEPGRKFPNTKLDTDYLALLHYADALASDETSGDMADMCRWLYGSIKKCISSEMLLAAIPTENQIRLDAYYRWVELSRTHGHDVADWLDAEGDLYRQMWDSL